MHCQCAPKTAVELAGDSRKTGQEPFDFGGIVPSSSLDLMTKLLTPACSTLKPPFCTCTGGAGNPRNCSCAGCAGGLCGCKSCQICNSPGPPPSPAPKASKPVDLWEDHAPAYGINGTYSCNLYSGKAVALIEDHAANYASQGMFLYLPCESPAGTDVLTDSSCSRPVDASARRLV